MAGAQWAVECVPGSRLKGLGVSHPPARQTVTEQSWTTNCDQMVEIVALNFDWTWLQGFLS